MDTNRIQHLISKIYSILTDKETKSAIDVDLMLDYTRVMYADLLDLKKELDNVVPSETISPIADSPIQEELPSDKQQIAHAIASEEKANTSHNHEGIVMEIPIAANAPIEPQQDITGALPTHFVSENPVEIPTEVSSSIDNTRVNMEAIQVSKEGVSLPSEKPAERKEVRKLIGINDKYLFMNELFNNDKFDYESVLDYINQSNDIQTVNAWLNKEYIENGKWNKEDATVDLFYGVVTKYFSNFK